MRCCLGAGAACGAGAQAGRLQGAGAVHAPCGETRGAGHGCHDAAGRALALLQSLKCLGDDKEDLHIYILLQLGVSGNISCPVMQEETAAEGTLDYR